jgi:hypothetical protein
MSQSEPAVPPVPSPATRRSWYLPGDVADELAAAVDELHYSMRVPKHAALAAIVRVGMAHEDEVRAGLRGRAD